MVEPVYRGIYAELQGISALSMLQEERSVRFASLSDSKGNVWQGLSIRTLIEKYEKLRGLELVQYFLNVPGVPLLCCVNVITNGTGKVLPGFSCENNDFFSPDEDIKHCWIRGSDKTLYKSGKAQTEIKSGGVIQYGSDRREDTLLVVTNEPERAAAFTNNKVVHHFTPDRTMLLHDAVHTTKPMFYMFHDSFVPYSSFQDLLRITFKN